MSGGHNLPSFPPDTPLGDNCRLPRVGGTLTKLHRRGRREEETSQSHSRSILPVPTKIAPRKEQKEGGTGREGISTRTNLYLSLLILLLQKRTLIDIPILETPSPPPAPLLQLPTYRRDLPLHLINHPLTKESNKHSSHNMFCSF